VPDDSPLRFALYGAVPNPFNPTSVLEFSLPASQHVTLGVYDVRGRLVRLLVDEVRTAGIHIVPWDGRDSSGRAVASGTYFARLWSATESSVKAMTMVQ
jgi:flagellar hook assembly protein FlgD